MIVKIDVTSFGALNVLCEGGARYALAPGANLDGQPPEVVTAANKEWTPEVLAAYKALVERNAEI